MKYATILIFLVFSFTAVVQAADENDFKKKYLHCLDNADLDIDDDNLIIRDDDIERLCFEHL